MSQTHVETNLDVAAPAQMIRMATGYRISQAVYVAARLGLADLLRDGPKTVAELARDSGTHAPSLHRLLRALAALEVLREVEPDERFALTPLGACLQSDAPDSMRDAVLMWGNESFWHTWGDLLRCVQTGESAVSHLYGTPNPFEYYAQHPDLAAVMNAGFAANGRLTVQAVVAAYDFSQSGTVVDVGGGRGQLIATILRAHPALRGVLFDQPQVVAEAVPLLEEARVADRCDIVGGDMFSEVPSGGDTYALMSIIHDWDDVQALAILRSCHRAMRPQTTIVLIERVLPDHITTAATAQTLADLNMLVRTSGRERTEREHRELLEAAGFTLASITPTPIGFSVIIATRG